MATNKLLILHPNCPGKEELKAACQDDVTVVFYVPPAPAPDPAPMHPEMELPESDIINQPNKTDEPESTNLTELCKDAKQVGLVWQNKGNQTIPFDGFEDMLHDELTVDLITCTLGKEGFKERMQALESNYTNLQIRYSLDKTANPEQGGDWIMESHGTSVKSEYFTDALSSFTHVLDTIYHAIQYSAGTGAFIINTNTNSSSLATTIVCESVEFQGELNWLYNHVLTLETRLLLSMQITIHIMEQSIWV